MGRVAVFLDRDGTLNVRPGPHRYVTSGDQFVWLDRAAEGAARLARAGYVLVVVSNQRGVARGLVDEQTLRDIESRIQERLATLGAKVEQFRYCPHEADAGCACRKPLPGLLLAAADDLGIELGRSWMVGDSDADVEAGRAAGCRTLLLPRDAADLAAAAAVIERHESGVDG